MHKRGAAALSGFSAAVGWSKRIECCQKQFASHLINFQRVHQEEGEAEALLVVEEHQNSLFTVYAT